MIYITSFMETFSFPLKWTVLIIISSDCERTAPVHARRHKKIVFSDFMYYLISVSVTIFKV